MKNVFALPEQDRRDLFLEAASRKGITPDAIEKDFWACWILKELFSLPTFGKELTFKGGTSLSKAWKIVERFSEDLDVVIDRAHIGITGTHLAPEAAPGSNELKRRLDQLQDRCRTCVCQELLPSLISHVGNELSGAFEVAGDFALKLDRDDPAEQTILFTYPSCFGAGGYIQPVVKIELGARSDTEPREQAQITSYLAELIPDAVSEASFAVRTVAPERTFWEKVMLLHEEGYRTDDSFPKARLARHYYDIWAMISKGVSRKALEDASLFDAVVDHRKIFFRRSKAAQDTLGRGSMRIIPTEDKMALWKRDYEAMRESMFFTEPPAFEEIIEAVAKIEQEINTV